MQFKSARKIWPSLKNMNHFVFLRSRSIGINPFWLDGLVGLFCVLLGKNRFWLVWLINLFNQPQTGLKWLKKQLLDSVAVIVTHVTNVPRNYPRFNQKRLEKCSTEKGQPYQPKPVAAETVDPNRTRPKLRYILTPRMGRQCLAWQLARCSSSIAR